MKPPAKSIQYNSNQTPTIRRIRYKVSDSYYYDRTSLRNAIEDILKNGLVYNAKQFRIDKSKDQVVR